MGIAPGCAARRVSAGRADPPRIAPPAKRGFVQSVFELTVGLLVNEGTENRRNETAFARMKPDAFFIMMSRGNLVDEAALLGC